MSDASAMEIPDPKQSRCFVFVGCDHDSAAGESTLVYRYDDGPELVERITFPHAPWPPDASRQAAFRRALEILHLIAGVSYYKAGLPRQVRFEKPDSANGLTDFLTGLYVNGLAEFGYVNHLDISECVRFPGAGIAGRPAESKPRPLLLPDRALVAMGGGKDSLVGLDLLKKTGLEFMPICVGESSLIRDTVRTAGLPLIQIRRELAPELAAMNRAGAWNGHVPVTAINSAILLCASILYGFRYIVFSNERSADEATLVSRDGTAINHQYSKGSAFESAFRSLIAERVSPDIEYFSVLRPFSELGIVRHFADMREFHNVYSSCNRNFHIGGSQITGRWCLDCPKCRFAALSLALFLSPSEVTLIQGGDLLDDPAQLDGFRALCGLGKDKPFECVGEIGESRAALAALAGRDDWAGHVVVQALQAELAGVDMPSLRELLTPAKRHFIPEHLCSKMGLERDNHAGG